MVLTKWGIWIGTDSKKEKLEGVKMMGFCENTSLNYLEKQKNKQKNGKKICKIIFCAMQKVD